MLYKRFTIIMVILALLILAIGVVGAARIDPSQRPLPPNIQTYGIPAAGGEPAECAGAPGCGTMCFYISENAAENQHELSCIPWIFE